MKITKIFSKVNYLLNNLEKRKYCEIISEWDNLGKEERLKMITCLPQNELEILQEIERLDKERSRVSDRNSKDKSIESFLGKINSIQFIKNVEVSLDEFQNKMKKVQYDLDKQDTNMPYDEMNRMDLDFLDITFGENKNQKIQEKNYKETSERESKFSNITQQLGHQLSPTSEVKILKENPAVKEKLSFSNISPTSIRNETMNCGLDLLLTLKINPKEKTESYLILSDLKINPENLIKIKIEDSFFLDCKPCSLPPDYSKSVNIGDSLIITGGSENNRGVDSCYLLKVTPTSVLSNSKVIIQKYPKLNTKRERHNILYMKDRMTILVCGGFYTKSTEVSIENTIWKTQAPMKHERGNATMLYLNQKFVYCIGGYEMLKESKTGAYLSSCEYLDMDSPDSSWTLINLENLVSNFKLCAMGAINLGKSEFLLVGGYDGSRYLNECHEVVFDKEKPQKISHREKITLPKGTIFNVSEFFRLDDKFYNFDLQGKLLIFENEKKSFSFRTINF
jgi:hypothetical protein